MKRTTIEIAIFALLVSAGAASRVVFRELPNFAPIAAMALFAGYFFRSAALAALVPLSAMAASDLVLGGYEWKLMLIVYGALTLPVACRSLVRNYLSIERGRVGAALAALGGLVGCSLACSLLFFLATNFGCWLWTDMYARDWSGLVQCYAQALPFFRHTLAGDMFYACLLFGSYALAVQWGWQASVAKSPKPAVTTA